MSDVETIQIQTGDKVEEHKVTVKPITLICSGPDMVASKFKYPDRFEITPEMTVYHAQRVKQLHKDFVTAWNIVFKDQDNKPEPDIEKIRQGGTGFLHLTGLIDMTLKLTDQGVPLVFIHPESHLHPALQCALGDFLIYMTQRNKGQDNPAH